MIRAIKPLRWLKIARIMKLGKAGPIINILKDYWNISPKQGKTVKVLVVLVLCIHIVSCIWWLWNTLASGNGVNDTASRFTRDAVNAFLDRQVRVDVRVHVSCHRTSVCLLRCRAGNMEMGHIGPRTLCVCVRVCV